MMWPDLFGRWRYHCRMGRTVERMYRQALFDRVVGAEKMRSAREHWNFVAGEHWSVDELMILRRKSL